MYRGRLPGALNLKRHCCLFKKQKTTQKAQGTSSRLLEDCRNWAWHNHACWSHEKLYPGLPKLGYWATCHEWLTHHMNLWWCRQQRPCSHRSNGTQEECGLARGYSMLWGGIVLVENHCSKDDWWTDTVGLCFEQTDISALSHHGQGLAKLLIKACCCEFSKALGEGVEIWTAQGVQEFSNEMGHKSSEHSTKWSCLLSHENRETI